MLVFGILSLRHVSAGARALWANRYQAIYPLAILAYNPNEPAPTTSTGQTLFLDISNSNSVISGIVYTGGTADFNPVTVDGSLIGWDVNINNGSTRVTYNPTYGNAAPPPAFTSPITGSGGGIAMYPATWVHCTNYTDGTGADDFTGPGGSEKFRAMNGR